MGWWRRHRWRGGALWLAGAAVVLVALATGGTFLYFHLKLARS
jgi:hypothetical protein